MVKNGNLVKNKVCGFFSRTKNYLFPKINKPLKPLIKESSKNKKVRVWEVDFLRGLCIVLMLFDHLMYNFAFMPSMTQNFWQTANQFFIDGFRLGQFYWTMRARTIIRVTVVFLFLFLSGISCSFSKNNGKRFFKMLAAAGIVMVATLGLDLLTNGGMFILFGILHIMAFSIGFYCLVKLCFRKFTPIACFLFGAIIVGLGFTIQFYEMNGLSRLWNDRWTDLRQFWWIAVLSFAVMAFFLITVFIKKFSKKIVYEKKNRANAGGTENIPQFAKKRPNGRKNLFLIEYAIVVALIAGFILMYALFPRAPMEYNSWHYFCSLFIGTGSFGADFYGIFPFMGVFLLGAATGSVVYRKKRSLLPKAEKLWFTQGGYAQVGRNAIWMYLSHQVLFFGIVMLAAMGTGLHPGL